MPKRYRISDNMTKEDLLKQLESLKDEARYMFRTTHDYIFKLDLIALTQTIKIINRLDFSKLKVGAK